MARSYSREEVQAILGRALERQHASAERDGLSHDELVAVGRELGVPADAIESAAVEIDGELETTKAVDDRIKRMRRALGSHLLSTMKWPASQGWRSPVATLVRDSLFLRTVARSVWSILSALLQSTIRLRVRQEEVRRRAAFVPHEVNTLT